MTSISAVSKDIFTKTLTLSKAEKAFKPWWNTLENYILYSVIMIAVMVVQTDVKKGTSMDCTFCQSSSEKNYCRDYNGSTFNNTRADPKFSFKWVRQQCSSPGLDLVRYYPYIIIVQGIILLVTKRLTSRVFTSREKMKKWFEFVSAVWEDKTDHGAKEDFTIDAIHMKDQFRSSCDYYYGCILQSCSLLTLASGFVFNTYYRKQWREFQKADHYICTLHGHYYYECHGMPFFMYLCSFYMANGMMILLILLQIYNILWMCFPHFGKLSREMRSYRKNLCENLQEQKWKKVNKKNRKELLGDLYDIYYNGKDLAFLLNLLTSSSGIAESLVIMTVLDKKFRENLTPKIESASRTIHDGKAEIILKVAQLSPPTSGPSIQILEKLPGDRVTVTFSGLKPSQDYKINIFTVINGKKIHEETENIVARDNLERPSLQDSPNTNTEDQELTLVSFDTKADMVSFNNIGYNYSDLNSTQYY